MSKILWYSFSDLARSKWSYSYFAFYCVLGFALLFLTADLSKAIATLMNAVIVLTPLIGTIFGVIYVYNARDFTELLLAQPIKRRTIFLGQYLGLASSLSISFACGLGIPFLGYGLFESDKILDFTVLLIDGVILTFIFTGISFLISIKNDHRIAGFSYAIMVWLFLAVIYDGLFLISLLIFDTYPLERYSLWATMLNPIDLSRILILLKLDIAALLGYTGAIYKHFFGTNEGILVSFAALVGWVVWPVLLMLRIADRKDF